MFWVETKGMTLEEIDGIFEGEKHSSGPDVEAVRTGRAEADKDEEKAEHEEQAHPGEYYAGIQRLGETTRPTLSGEEDE